MPDQQLDARGLKCPLPVLKARKRLGAMTSGEVLVVAATDPAAPADFEAFCEATGHRLAGIAPEVDSDATIIRVVCR